ncbi:hypothetical protein DAEQUDRAFT_190075 [Daedalea quercina L-15889]|uniref:Uncharacterized protein n=1 Tax=Daedalea quercina L-15889 TaxID=1314783 RepID=A0A165U3Z6_9APHY|nr:hypothetical protein DAEQUDRAFT_190075 [Daedalea quercina L-15889]
MRDVRGVIRSDAFRHITRAIEVNQRPPQLVRSFVFLIPTASSCPNLLAPGSPHRSPLHLDASGVARHANSLRIHRTTIYAVVSLGRVLERLSNQSRSVFSRPSIPLSVSSALAASFDTPGGKIQIRADPALVTCFDPSDKELYDLWAPRR